MAFGESVTVLGLGSGSPFTAPITLTSPTLPPEYLAGAGVGAEWVIVAEGGSTIFGFYQASAPLKMHQEQSLVNWGGGVSKCVVHV